MLLILAFSIVLMSFGFAEERFSRLWEGSSSNFFRMPDVKLLWQMAIQVRGNRFPEKLNEWDDQISRQKDNSLEMKTGAREECENFSNEKLIFVSRILIHFLVCSRRPNLKCHRRPRNWTKWEIFYIIFFFLTLFSLFVSFVVVVVFRHFRNTVFSLFLSLKANYV